MNNFIFGLRILYCGRRFSLFLIRFRRVYGPKPSKTFCFFGISLLLTDYGWRKFEGLLGDSLVSVVYFGILAIFGIGLGAVIKFPAFLLILCPFLMLESISTIELVEFGVIFFTGPLTKWLTFVLV